MSGLDTRGLASGFAQGFGLMNQYQQQQFQNERAEKQDAMQAEQFDMQKQQFSAQQEDVQRQRDMEEIQFTLGKIGSGMDVAEDELETLRRYPKFWAALDPQTDASINQAMAVIDPDTTVDANDPESLEALNQMFGAEINRGEGGQKRVVGMYPAPDGQSVALELEVVGEDGNTYRAPMTEGRGTADDDLVKYVPVEALVEQVQGMRLLRNTMRTPEAQQRATQVLGLLRGDSNERWEQVEGPGGSILQRNTVTGETKQVIGRAPQAGGSGSSTPSRIQEAQALVEREVYPTFAEAYEAVRARAGESSQMDTRYISFLGDELDRVDEQLDSYSLSEEARVELSARREQLAQELDVASRQAFDRPGGQQAANQQPAQQPDQQPENTQPGAPQVGHVEDGYEFLGGDPANPDNWRAR
ncbi:hypothetical protein [Halomonas sp. Cn5-12]|jgi:hypothetical protein|uniref:hypothetical protein n=1 Tax=Halomonas sp. Cn5-12 TaxID=2908885 RepID=UPI001F3A06CF|nr:hypothetical protein [Halomonas sp. Cn5-12]MCF2911924.1 hypothetical protein [Halomonas sp. Cn5-12]